MQEGEEENLGQYLELMDIGEAYGYVMVLSFGERAENGQMTNVTGSSVRMNQHYDRLSQLLSEAFGCITGPVMGNRIVLYVPCREAEMSYQERADLVGFVRKLLTKLEQEFGLTFAAGIGDVFEVHESHASYTEAMNALRRGQGHVLHIMDLQQSNNSRPFPLELEDRYVQLCLKTDSDGADECMERIFSWFAGEGEMTPDEIKMRLLKLYLRLEDRCAEMELIPQSETAGIPEFSALQSMEDPDRIFEWFRSVTHQLMSLMKHGRKSETESIVGQAVGYIRLHFHEEITLDELSRRANISPYYFSKLFKQTTGENFIEYLTSLRMEKAKEYLANQKNSVKEVSAMCGYSDPNYFARIFKKNTGMSPREFRG